MPFKRIGRAKAPFRGRAVGGQGARRRASSKGEDALTHEEDKQIEDDDKSRKPFEWCIVIEGGVKGDSEVD